MKIPINIGIIHFIGIGGIGMSGIAEILHRIGYKIQGSDQKESANTRRLRKLGVEIFIGHRAENIGAAEVVVISSAVKLENVEYAYAIAHDLPVVKRAEMLAELMRFKRTIAVGGTHGKTTTTSLVAALLASAGYEPTIVNGGIINEYGTNAIYGSGEWMVVEADESDGSFLKLPSDIAIITNIDPEHLDYYGSFEKLQKAFARFVENIPFYGFAVLCIDNLHVRELKNTVHTRRIITYGQHEKADVRFVIKEQDNKDNFGTYFDVYNNKLQISFKDFYIPMLGVHNVSNATAAIIAALEIGASIADIKQGLAKFGGVGRRFTHVGSWNGVEIFDDYGHHPTEIKAVLKAARQASKGKIIAVAQPHRYSRLNNLFPEFASCFCDADIVVLTPIYAAGEESIKGASSQELAANIKNAESHLVATQEELAGLIKKIAKPDDYVICLGAGDITKWAHNLPMNLAQ